VSKTHNVIMPKTAAPPEFPAPGDGAGATPHTLDQLMAGSRSSGGFRLLYTSKETRWCDSPTIVYVVDHGSGGGYEFTVISSFHHERLSQDAFFTDIEQRSDVLDPPDALSEATWEQWQRKGGAGVRLVLDAMTPDDQAPETAEVAA